MNLRIRNAELNDCAAILELMREFAVYEDLLSYLEITEEGLGDVMFGDRSFVEALVALDDSAPIGYALFYQYFASFRGQRGIYIEDIFITERCRKSGIGEKMLRQIAAIGKQRGAVRLDFQVLKWNVPAVNFYKKLGASIDGDERHFKFTDVAFERLAE